MTESTKAYEEFVSAFLAAMNTKDLDTAKDLTDGLSAEDKIGALDALMTEVATKDDEFKEDNKEIIEALTAASELLAQAAIEPSTEPASSTEVESTEEAPAEKEEA